MGAWSIQPSVRVDHFQFKYVDDLANIFDRQSNEKTVATPNLSIIYNASNNVQLFAKSGIGFHSNDSRVVLQNEVEEILPLAYGVDVGALLKPAKRLIANIGFWYLGLEQEFVYVGDEGVVEPSGETRRLGVDFGLRYQVTDWLFASGDVNYAYARSIDEPEGADYIPLAPDLTATGGIAVQKDNIQANLQFRYVKDRPANETNDIVAEGYFITDLSANYNFKRVSLGFTIENLFDQDWNETQFATESRLRDEPNSTEEIHFTPGVPFFMKGVLRYRF